MNPIALGILALLAAIITFGSKRQASLSLMASVLFLHQSQGIQVFSVNIFPHRFLEVAGAIRVLARGEIRKDRLSRIDKTILLLYIYSASVYLLRVLLHSSSIDASITGRFVDAVLTYFIFISLIDNMSDFKWLMKSFSVLLLPYTALTIYEHFLSYNPFVFLGAPYAHPFRKGVPRCMATFRAAILFGTLGASFLPIYIGLFLSKTNRMWNSIGITTCILIVFLSNSGGPVAAMGLTILGWSLWIYRTKMRTVRRTILGLFLSLLIVMKAPIWFLPAKVSSITGGDGYHRSVLMDRAIKSIDKWWFYGMSFKNTKNWFPYINQATGHADITNVYIQFGITAGIGAIIIIIMLFVRAYKALGKALLILTSNKHGSFQDKYILWGLGVALTVHAVTWISVTYFDQLYMVWFMQLAAISKVTHNIIFSGKEIEESVMVSQ